MWIFYPKRCGWRWQVWCSYCDKRIDPASGASEWRAVWGLSFWRWLNAARVASDMGQAYAMSCNYENMPPDECP